MIIEAKLIGSSIIKTNCVTAKIIRNEKDRMRKFCLCFAEFIGLAGESTGANKKMMIDENRIQKTDMLIKTFILV